ncbi:hypothetical protein [Fluviicola sp.]|uniref:hypothetical protein n=1 Tax=Fluviicola sp. TaxID=1917219 RepID=UPI0031DDAC5E
MELHPRLDLTDLPLKQQKIILGSFPVWSHTISEPSNITEEIDKKKNRLERGDIDFFFGSTKNNFWKWYRSFVDLGIQIGDIDSIKGSLVTNKIGITDLIIQCKRKDKSALDKHLTDRVYNYMFFDYPQKDETIKILCTSKGLMNEMLLTPKFFKIHPTFKIDTTLSESLQKDLLSNLNNCDHSLIKRPFFRKLFCDSGGSLECFAIPSPGSPYRKLTDFGFKGEDNNRFLNEFLSIAFNWFS